ncbi:MAG: type II secretion system F family protein [Oscillibacter sp.]|nr:type II secretion system F family protein [Oscillibacter sp.]
MVILIPVLALSTALVVIWFLLLGQVSQDDWIVAAYNKVLNSRNEAERLRRKDADHARKLAQYHGVSAKVMKLFLGGNSKKEIQKLHRQEQALQQGDLRSVSLFEMPGYVIQRKFESIGRGSIHKAVLEKYSELYGKKYAVNQTKQLLARMLSYPLLALPVVWALGSLLLASGNRTGGLAVLGVGSLLVLGLVYAMYDEVSDRLNKRRAAISRQFPNVVSKLALLVTSGMIMDRAWRETAESQDMVLYQEMRKTADELSNLVDPATAYTNFINRCNTKETTKLASAIIQNLSKGNAEIGVLLKSMAHEAWQERRHTAKRDSEKANSKLMIPTMMLFIAILVMIMVPVAMNFSAI